MVVFHAVAFVHDHVLPTNLERRKEKRGVHSDRISTTLLPLHPHQRETECPHREISWPVCPQDPRLAQSQTKALSYHWGGKTRLNYNTHLSAQSGSLYDYMSAKQHGDHRGQWKTRYTGSIIVWQHLGESTETQHRGQSDWLGSNTFWGLFWGFGKWEPASKNTPNP